MIQQFLRHLLQVLPVIGIFHPLSLRGHIVIDCLQVFLGQFQCPLLDQRFERISRHKGINELAIQGVCCPIQGPEGNAFACLGFFESQRRWLANAEPPAQLRGGHAERLTDRPIKLAAWVWVSHAPP